MLIRRKLGFCASAAGALVLSGAVWCPPAAAVTAAQTTMAVAATVVSVCQVVATPLVFGNYAATTATPADSTSTIQVVCNAGTSYDVGLDQGQHGPDVNSRAMANVAGVGTLAYSLFQDSGRSVNWGNTPGTDTVNETSVGTTQTLTVFGRIAPGLMLTPTGAYTDTIMVTVTF